MFLFSHLDELQKKIMQILFWSDCTTPCGILSFAFCDFCIGMSYDLASKKPILTPLDLWVGGGLRGVQRMVWEKNYPQWSNQESGTTHYCWCCQSYTWDDPVHLGWNQLCWMFAGYAMETFKWSFINYYVTHFWRVGWGVEGGFGSAFLNF